MRVASRRKRRVAPPTPKRLHVFADQAARLGAVVDEEREGRAARQRLEAHGARAGEQVEDARARDRVVVGVREDVEDRLAQAVGGRADGVRPRSGERRPRKRPPTILTAIRSTIAHGRPSGRAVPRRPLGPPLKPPTGRTALAAGPLRGRPPGRPARRTAARRPVVGAARRGAVAAPRRTRRRLRLRAPRRPSLAAAAEGPVASSRGRRGRASLGAVVAAARHGRSPPRAEGGARPVPSGPPRRSARSLRRAGDPRRRGAPRAARRRAGRSPPRRRSRAARPRPCGPRRRRWRRRAPAGRSAAGRARLPRVGAAPRRSCGSPCGLSSSPARQTLRFGSRRTGRLRRRRLVLVVAPRARPLVVAVDAARSLAGRGGRPSRSRARARSGGRFLAPLAASSGEPKGAIGSRTGLSKSTPGLRRELRRRAAPSGPWCAPPRRGRARGRRAGTGRRRGGSGGSPAGRDAPGCA